jgi:hypothetical protein
MKKAKRKAVRVKPAVKPVEVAILKRGEIVKVAPHPDKVLHVEAPPDPVPVVAVHPTSNIVQTVPVPKKKLTWWQSVFGE